MGIVQITPEEAVTTLEHSGYMLESRVESILYGLDFDVLPNPVYSDPFTAKSREIDIVARVLRGKSEKYNIDVTLIIECMNNPQPFGCIINSERFENIYLSSLFDLSDLLKVSSNVDSLVLNKHPMLDQLAVIDKQGTVIENPVIDLHCHLQEAISDLPSCHYLKRNIATQYCSFKEKNSKKNGKTSGEWMAWHDNEHHDVFGKFPFIMQRAMELQQIQQRDSPGEINISIFYPIIVLQGALWEILQNSDRNIRINETSHVGFIHREPSQSLVSLCDYYHVDIIQESYLPEFLNLIKQHVAEIETLILSNFSKFRDAIVENK